MSARGSIGLGSKVLAESKRLIPISWLAFLTPDHVEPLLDHGSVSIERKTAIENFDRNAPFLAETTSGELNFDLSERLISPVRSSRARKLSIDIAELIADDGAERDLPGIKMVIDAIAKEDAKLNFSRPSCKMENPATGEMIKVKPIKLKRTADIIYSVCWITERWLEIADSEELEAMVTGHVWS